MILGELAATTTATPWPAALVRLVAACVLGGLIGFEREWHRKPAGLRTHIMVATGACLFALLTFEILALSASGGSQVRADPVRLISAIATGLGFLGAGTILATEGHVRGLTTAAGLWVAGAIGVACGIGQILLGATVTLLVLAVLVVLRWLETLWPKKEDRD
jgi:putative Mg2+ transporter-C (MgtC) family protein